MKIKDLVTGDIYECTEEEWEIMEKIMDGHNRNWSDPEWVKDVDPEDI
jgi:hypothetical protein